MKNILNKLFTYKTLTKEEAKQVLINISQQKYNHVQIASFLTVFSMRSVTVDEMTGFIEALQEGCISVDLKGYDTIDMCGTGGDGKNTFNISTIASFVVAGAGVNVAKHGNYGVSSGCGSSNLMEALGYTFSNDTAKLQSEIEKTGMCYMHAPLFHPPMKEVAPIRKQLIIRTFFNIAGPLVNPAFPDSQAVGVYNLEVARIYKYVLQKAHKKFIIMHSLDGYDEISLTHPVKLISHNFERVMTPEDLGLSYTQPEKIAGGETVSNAIQICMDILTNKATDAQKNVVVANAAMGIKSLRDTLSFDECINMARESLESGKAHSVMKTLCS
ncbi:MAG: anthranilate phosphoribosyltransferase [Bacteroidales bacterium]